MLCHATAEGATRNGTYLQPAMQWGISSTSENKELAAEFINYFVNNSYVYEISGTDRGIPISSAMQEYVAGDDVTKRASEFIAFLADGVANPVSAIVPVGGAEAKAYIAEIFELLVFEQLERDQILETAKQAIEEGNAILKKNAAGQ